MMEWFEKNKKQVCFFGPEEKAIQDQQLLHLNRLDPRTNLVPALERDVFYRDKESSPLVQSLNGDWQFSYQEDDLLEDFFEPDYDASRWDVIDVPSMWQYRGYGKCRYTNTEYPIPFDPPYISCENPVGYYRRTFTLQEVPQVGTMTRRILHFGGVDNAFFVWVNGEFIGMAKGSRIPAEFDITNQVHEGENVLAVKVFTWSDATYLENQDMLMANGIFRDVYILQTQEVSLWDYRVRTELTGRFTIDINLLYEGQNGYTVAVTLDGQTREFSAAELLTYTFDIQESHLWNAEDPYLYDLYIELKKNGIVYEVYSKKVGIMHAEVKGNQFLVNGTPVVIKGMNRHEYDCKNGRTITVEQIEHDLDLIKASNLNAIRCSHYTNHPAFYEYASKIGLYVMDEADLETHGCGVVGDQGYLSKDPSWKAAYIDRVDRMLKGDKNETCIFMWSIGNEAGRGPNLKACAEYIRAYDPTREINQAQDGSDEPEYTHFRKEGYMPMERLVRFDEQGLPVLLVEFAHCMGNGPGYLQQYWEYIFTHEPYIGGFVWEFKSHGFEETDEKGRKYYLFGGDFDDPYHWSNFSVDGILKSDGTPKPALRELKEAVGPVLLLNTLSDPATIADLKPDLQGWNKAGILHIQNTLDFTALDQYTVNWKLVREYTEVQSGTLQLPAIAPHAEGTLQIPFDHAGLGDGAAWYLNLEFCKGTTAVEHRQIRLTKAAEHKPAFKKEKLEILTSGRDLTLNGTRTVISFHNGLLQWLSVDGKTLIDQPMELCFNRAQTDNDGILGLERFPWLSRHGLDWKRAQIPYFKFRMQSMIVEQKDDHMLVSAKGRVTPDAIYIGFDIELNYRIYEGGILQVEVNGWPYGTMPDVLPRIGVRFALDKAFDRAAWYGRGPELNYADFLLAALMGRYEASVQDMNFKFDVPQETGNHENTVFARILAEDGRGLTVSQCAADGFAFSLHDFTLENLDQARHCNELEEAAHTYLYVDYRQRGLGSASCGPDPEPQYELKPHDFRFCFVLSPDRGDEEALRLARLHFPTHTEARSEGYTYEPLASAGKENLDCK